MGGFDAVGGARRRRCRCRIRFEKGFRSKPLPANPPKGAPGKWAWIAVGVLWIVVMLNYFDRQLLAVLNSSITESENGIEMTQAQFGTVTSAFLIVYAALSPVGGYLSDRFSRKFIILCSLVVWSIVTWLTGKAETYEELLLARAAMGISKRFTFPPRSRSSRTTTAGTRVRWRRGFT